MDDRIMKVLEAAGGRIAELEAEVAEMNDANNYVCGLRDKAETENSDLRNEIESLKQQLVDKGASVLFWYKQVRELEGKLAVANGERATVEAVD